MAAPRALTASPTVIILLMCMVEVTIARRPFVTRNPNIDCSRKSADGSTCQEAKGEVNCGHHYVSPGSEVTISTNVMTSSRRRTCKWQFQTDENVQLESVCEVAMPTRSSGCQNAFLLITGGTSRRHRLCGNKSVTITSKANVLNIIPKIGRRRSTSNYFKCTLKVLSGNETSIPKCKCGRVNRMSRITGGNEVRPNTFSWQVALVENDKISPFCGGSIISDSFVLTAAHCVYQDGVIYKPEDLRIVIGEHDWATPAETNITRRVGIKRILPHPEAPPPNFGDNDIALLELEESLLFPEDNSLSPVCLPPPDREYPEANSLNVGWGGTNKVNDSSDVLRAAEVTTMRNSVCQGFYLLTNTITKNMICTGPVFSGRGSCPGDSGGPLLTRGEECEDVCHIIIGVVSFGKILCTGALPTVYTRVNHFLNWIHHHIGDSNTCQQK